MIPRNQNQTLETIIKHKVKSELISRFNKLRSHLASGSRGELIKLVESHLIQEGVVAVRFHSKVFRPSRNPN